MNKNQLDRILIEECKYTERSVKEMTPREKVDAWLRYNGIIGYTDDVLDVVGAAYDLDLQDFDIVLW